MVWKFSLWIYLSAYILLKFRWCKNVYHVSVLVYRSWVIIKCYENIFCWIK